MEVEHIVQLQNKDGLHGIEELEVPQGVRGRGTADLQCLEEAVGSKELVSLMKQQLHTEMDVAQCLHESECRNHFTKHHLNVNILRISNVSDNVRQNVIHYGLKLRLQAGNRDAHQLQEQNIQTVSEEEKNTIIRSKKYHT